MPEYAKESRPVCGHVLIRYSLRIQILPNGVGMGSTTITVNVSASETSADSSNGQGASLGKAIGLAVQLELIKQKRPGGLLATV